LNYLEENDGWKIINREIEGVSVFDKNGKVILDLQGNKAIDFLINREREFLKKEAVKASGGISDPDYKEGHVWMVKTKKTSEKSKNLRKKNKSFYNIKAVVFNLSSLKWPTTGTVLYSLFSRIPIEEYKKRDEIKFTDEIVQCSKYRNWYYLHYKQLETVRQEISHVLVLDAIIDNPNGTDERVYKSKNYGTIEIYESKDYGDYKSCVEKIEILFLGNPNDTPYFQSPNQKKNLAKTTFEDIMKEIEKDREFKKWIDK
jgi:hypothetical protein